MKKIYLISLLPLVFFGSIAAQDRFTGKSVNSFIEWNFGLSLLVDVSTSRLGRGEVSREYFVFPGTSVLWGQTRIFKNDFILEYELGLAIPTGATGKIGVGKKIGNTNYVFGVRPFPFHLYSQSTIKNGEKGSWIISLEFNPLKPNASLSFGSKALLNFGYRWNVGKRK